MRSPAHISREDLQSAMLVVDSSLPPLDGSLLICCRRGEFRVKRYRKASPYAEDLESGRRESLPDDDDSSYSGSRKAYIRGNPHTSLTMPSGESDDCPVI